MKRWRLGASALAVLATVGVCVLFLPALRQTARPAAALSSHPIRWVLDAGHGGEDGGAVSVTGVAESGINLDIVRRMGRGFRALGAACLPAPGRGYIPSRPRRPGPCVKRRYPICTTGRRRWRPWRGPPW